MARKYATTGAGAVASSPGRTILIATGTAATRAALYDIVLGFASPADNSIQWVVGRYTVAGTTTGVTPAPLDPGNTASIFVSGENASAEPTYTAARELLDGELNQRATFRWVAAPGGELMAPATAANGIGLYVIHASVTATARVTFHVEE
jgi:hypothetical protein